MTRDEAAKHLPCLTRRYILLGGFFVGGIAVWALALFVLVLGSRAPVNAIPPTLTNHVMRFAFVPPMVLAAAASVMHFRWGGKLRRDAVRASFRLCPHCCYNLVGAAPLGASTGRVRCPECGHEVDLAKTQELWWAWTEWPITQRKD